MEDESGLLIDLDAAKRNREMIQNMRNKGKEGALKTQKINATSGAEQKPPAKSKRLNIINNRGKTNIYDTRALLVIEDAKTMSWRAAFTKNGIPVGSLTGLVKHWKEKGIIPENVKLGKYNKGGGEKVHKSATPQKEDQKKQAKLITHSQLPAWNEAWGDSVKVAWLNALFVGSSR